MNILNRLKKTQNKAIRILNFKVSKQGAEKLYKKLKIDKVRNIIMIANC